MANEETEKCPKPACKQPERTHRFRAGNRESICGNGHAWVSGDSRAKSEQSAHARYIEAQAAADKAYNDLVNGKR